MRRRRGRLYSQTPLPFWPAMAGRIAIGSRAAAEPLVRFLVLHEPMDMQFHCLIIKRLQLKRKKNVFPIQASSTQYSFHISGNRGYNSNRVRFFLNITKYVFLNNLIQLYMLNKIYIHIITTLFVLKFLYCCNYIPWYLSKLWREHEYFVTNAISKTQLNMYFNTQMWTQINSAQIVFTLQNTNK